MHNIRTKITSIIMAALMLIASVPLQAYASSDIATINVSATLNDNVVATLHQDGLLEFSGTGRIKAFSSAASYPWYSYKTQIASVKYDEGILAVPQNSFDANTAITSVEFASSIIEVGSYSFRNCSALSAIKFDGDSTLVDRQVFDGSAFVTSRSGQPYAVTDDGKYLIAYSSTSIADVVIPDGVVSVAGLYVTSAASGIKTISYPDSVKIISDYAFFQFYLYD